MQTQWQFAGMGGKSGLNYAGVRAHLDELGLCGPERREVWNGVRAAERSTLDALAELAEQERAQTPNH